MDTKLLMKNITIDEDENMFFQYLFLNIKVNYPIFVSL